MRKISILLLLSLVTGLSFAGEPATDKNSSKKAEVKIQLQTPQGTPAAAKLRVLNTHSQPVLYDKGLDWLWVEDPVNLQLKPGSYSLLFKRGPRTQPLSKIITVPQKGLNLTFKLKHYAPVAAAGWLAADPYVQAAGITTDGFQYGTLEKLSLSGCCEGMKFIAADGLWQLASENGQKFALLGNAIHNLLESLQKISSKGCAIAAGSSVQRPGLGRFYVLEAAAPISAHRLVGENLLYPALLQARQRGGLCVISHPAGLAGGAQIARELVLDTIAGPMYDLIDISHGERDIAIWHTILNMGYRIPAISGGPDNSGDAGFFPHVGCYINVSRDNPDTNHFLKAIAKGKTIVSNGPFLRFFVENPSENPNLTIREKLARASHIGTSTFVSSQPREIWLDAYACSDPRDSIKRIDLIYNGKVIESAEGQRGQKTMQLKWNRVVLNRPGWLQVRYYSQAQDLYALSNPIYVDSSETSAILPAGCQPTLDVLDRNRRPINGAVVTAYNLGVKIGAWVYQGAPLKLSLPATANLSISAKGYATNSLDVYSASGGKGYINQLYAQGQLPDALAHKETYGKLRDILQKAKITITLLPAQPAR